MRRMRKTIVTLALTAGTTAAMAVGPKDGQTKDREWTNTKAAPEYRAERDRAVTDQLTFKTADSLLGSAVENANGTELGTIADVIVNRGCGSIEYVVVRDGGVLGFGGDLVAVPFDAFSYDFAGKAMRLDLTPEQLEARNAPSHARWVRLSGDDWIEDLEADGRWKSDRASYGDEKKDVAGDKKDRRGEMERRWERRDPFAKGIRGQERKKLRGVITGVDRSTTVHGEEQVSIEVRSEDGVSRRVVLGPSWYVMSRDAAPMRNDRAVVTGYDLPRDAQNRFVAKEATIAKDRLPLRGEDGMPNWLTQDSKRYDGGWDRSEYGGGPTTPLMKLTDLIDLDATARDEAGGEIEGAVLELHTGRVAMLTLDPDENFLGIADETKCVPWSIVGIGDDEVRIDADKEMLMRCTELPEDVRVFRAPSRLNPVYTVFSVEPAAFTPRSQRPVTAFEVNNERDLSEAYRRGASVAMRGSIVGLKDGTPFGLDRTWKVATFRSEGETKKVYIAPVGFYNEFAGSFDEDKMVTLHAVRVSGNGETLLFAEQIKGAKMGVLTFWRANEPMWDLESASATTGQ